MPPYQGGGDMIESVTFEKTTYAQICPTNSKPARRDIAGAIGLGAAIDYVQSIGFDSFVAIRRELCSTTRPQQLSEVPGPANHRHREEQGRA